MDELKRYTHDCLTQKFTGSGFALQDIVNEIGNRLGFDVTEGRYRGAKNTIGNDGLWKSPSGHTIVVEVKTTDAYRINLDTIGGYRKRLILKDGTIDKDLSSTLIVVGRIDTRDLEAQIRGSKYAFDIRIISTDSLINLLSIKTSTEDPDTEKRILEILMPREYTRVDNIIELAFSTTMERDQEREEIQQGETLTDDEEEKTSGASETGKEKPVSFNDSCVQHIAAELRVTLVKRSRVTYQSPDEKVRLVCAVSKEYPNDRGAGYWFAFHHHQKEFLEGTDQSYAGFGCGSPDQIILFPLRVITPYLAGMNHVDREVGQSYWYVRISSYKKGKMWVLRQRLGKKVDITQIEGVRLILRGECSANG